MPIRTVCPNCQTAYSLADHLAGKTVRCKKCDGTIEVRAAKARAAEDDSGVRRKIQTRPSAPQAASARDEEPQRSPRRKRNDERDLRRPKDKSNRGLIIGLAVGCGALVLLAGGGILLALILYMGKSKIPVAKAPPVAGPQVAGPPALVDVGGNWPNPHMLRAAPDTVVTLHIANVADEYTRDAVYDKVEALVMAGGNHALTSSSGGDRMTILAMPVRDVNAFSQKLDFGTVRSVEGRTITAVARKVEGPPPNADATAKALYRLKSISPRRRAEAARKLKETLPDDARRAEVVQALEPLLSEANLSTRQEAIEALGVWGNKDAFPILIKAMKEKETRVAAMRALGNLKDERAAEPLAERLDDFFERGEAASALKKMGPVAEPAVLARLNKEDWLIRTTACDVLKVIGTKKSLPSLEKIAATKDIIMAPKAKETIQAINARQ